MKKHLIKFSRYKVFIILYSLIILIPIIMIGVTGYNLIKEYLYESLLNNTKNSITYESIKLNEYINQLNKIEYRAKNEIIYQSKDIEQNYLDSFYGIKEYLSQNENLYEIVENIYFYDTTTNLFYSGDGIYKKEYFQKNCINFDDNIIKSNIHYQFLQGVKSNGQPIVLYIIPMEIDYNNEAKTFLIFPINNKELDEIFKYSKIDENDEFLLTYANDIIYSTNELINDHITKNKGEIRLLIDNYYEKTFYCFQPNEKLDFYITVYTLKHSFNKYIYYIVIKLCIVIFIVLIICSCMGRYLLKKNYMPIKELIEKVKNTTTKYEDAKDDYKFIDYIVNDLLCNNKSLEKTNDELFKEKCLYQILSNNKDSLRPNFLEQCKKVGINLVYESYMCLVVYELDENRKFKSEINQLIVNYKSMYLYYINITKAQTIYLICGEDKELNLLYSRIININCEKLKNTYIGVGKITSDYNKINKSFVYAQITAQFSVKNNINICNKIETENYEISYPDMEFEILNEAIKMNNTDKIIFALINLKKFIKKSNNEFVNTYIYCNIIFEIKENSMSQDISELISMNKNKFIDTNIETEIDKLIQKYSNFESETNNKKIKKYKKIDNIIEYINENYRDNNFSIKYMAAYMGTTQSNLSQYFKKHTNKNISDYIDCLKMDYAKSLLSEGETKISEIANDLGYSNASAFIKKFKKYNGITPGEYRKIELEGGNTL